MKFVPRRKTGYHATPLSAIAEAVDLIGEPEGDASSLSLFDPFAGDGAAILHLSRLLGVKPDRIYAVEASGERAEALRRLIPAANVLGPATLEKCSITKQTMSIALIHPPHADEHGGGPGRQAEYAHEALQHLVPGGIALVVADARCWKEPAFCNRIANALEWATMLPPWRDGESTVSMLIGQRRRRSESYANLPQILNKLPGSKYTLLPGRAVTHFVKYGHSDDEIIDLLNRSPLMKAAEPPEVKLAPEPPMELGRGHVALLLASGFLNGVIQKDGEPPHVVRGTARKAESLVSREDSSNDNGDRVRTSVYTEKIELHVRILTERGTLHDLSSGDSAA